MRPHSSPFPVFVLNRWTSKIWSLRTLMTASKCHVEAGFARISRETAREMSSTCALLSYLIYMMEREGDVAVKSGPALFCAVVAASGCSRWERSGCVSSQNF